MFSICDIDNKKKKQYQYTIIHLANTDTAS